MTIHVAPRDNNRRSRNNNNKQHSNRRREQLRSYYHSMNKDPLVIVRLLKWSSMKNVRPKPKCLFTKVSKTLNFSTRWESKFLLSIWFLLPKNYNVDPIGSHPSILLYSGAFSNVYKAIDLTAGKKVAGSSLSPRLAAYLSDIPLLQSK